MLPETIAAGVEELRAIYGERARVAADGQRTLVCVDRIGLFPGCQPPATDILLVLDPTQPKPKHYVRPGQTLSNGSPPKNPSIETVAGESWMHFSFNFQYSEGDPLGRFVTMIRQRFGKNE